MRRPSEIGGREAMKSNRNMSRGEGRRLENVAFIALMLGSLVLLSLIRPRFSPTGNHRRFNCFRLFYASLLNSSDSGHLSGSRFLGDDSLI